MKIGIISLCEAQFGISNFSRPGVCEFGTWVYGEITKLKKEVDYIIVSCHAGPEDSPWPIPYFIDLYKSYIDAGASIIHGHHSHIPQGYQEYKEGLIVYGCGNFLVDPDIWSDYQNGLWSYGIKVDFNKLNFKWSLQTFEILKVKDCIKVVKNNDNKYSEYIELCNKPLNDPILLEAIWQEVAMRIYLKFYSGLLGFQSNKSNVSFIKKIYRLLISYLKENSNHENNNTNHIIYHLFSCETHRQSIKTALGLLTNEVIDLRTSESSKLVDKLYNL
jgi:poly-gamma-glutamate synthesis protein (capsule biosynthesis protein)